MGSFDKIVGDYANLINSTLAISGGNMLEYFTAYKVYYLQEIIRTFVKRDNRIKMLDYGCGIGILSKAMFNAISGICVHGYDISEESINSIPQELRVNGNIFTTDLKMLDRDYDIAVLSNVLHHVELTDRNFVLNNIRKRLKYKGLVIIIEHNMKNPLTRKSVIDCPFDQDAHMLTMQQTSQLLTDASFGKQLKRYITFFPPKFAQFRRFDKYIGWIPLGAQYMICAINS